MKQRTQIFEYKGYVGIQAEKSENIEGLVKSSGLYYIVNVDSVDISPEALKVLKEMPENENENEVGIVMCFEVQKKDEKKKSVFGWFGHCWTLVKPGEKKDKDFNAELLTVNEDTIVPDTFITFVDSL